MIRLVVSLVAGFVFALGLGISGMTLPAKVTGFLDVFGSWDPSLALVMAGAIGVHLLPSLWALRRPAPLFDVKFHLPRQTEVDAQLVGGAALFGLGWGLAGYCPGPAVLSAGVLSPQAIVFVVAMVGGMGAWELIGVLRRGSGIGSRPRERALLDSALIDHAGAGGGEAATTPGRPTGTCRR